MLARALKYLRQKDFDTSLAIGFSRGAATCALRSIDPLDPKTWEFSAFSQNGEDGIIDYLTNKIRTKSRFFIEIGSSDGRTNCSSWLAFGRKFNGIMIEGNPILSARSKQHLQRYNLGVKHVQSFVDLDNCLALCEGHMTPDFFSIDIDGNDYHIVKKLMGSGFKPKVVCCEYNSAYGPDLAVTSKYATDFSRSKESGAWHYYGASIGAWKKLFKKHGYRFICSEQRGVNAFFVDPKEMPDLPDGLKGLEFSDNFAELVKFPGGWKEQLATIKHIPLENV